MSPQPIISPVPKDLLCKELTEELLLRKTNRANNEIYTFHALEAPNVMQELGRLREEAFRYYGGGSGHSVDIDDFDLDPNGYRQLIVWDPVQQIIVGGYRFMMGADIQVIDGKPHTASSEIFGFTDKFVQEYLPRCIELGRSFVRLEYQQARLSPKSIFALDNLWDGLGAVSMMNEGYEYFFGKVTMYKEYNRQARDLIIHFMLNYFSEETPLVYPIYPITMAIEREETREIILGDDLHTDYKRLNTAVRAIGVNIPPLINAYIGLSSSMKYFGTSINPHFSDVEESAILVPISEIATEKKKRHMESFLRDAAKRIPSAILRRINQRWFKG